MTNITNLRTAMTARVPVAAYPVNDPKDYANRIFLRFGIDTNDHGSAARIAKIENAAMRARLMTSPGGTATSLAHQGASPDTRYAVQREAAAQRHAVIHARIIDVLTKGEATKRDVSHALGCHVDTAGEYLSKMRKAGLISASTVGQTLVYAMPRVEAAE